MSSYYVTNASRLYHIVHDPSPDWHEGGPVLCGRRLERYGILVPMGMAGTMMASDCMCRRCKALYERRVGGRAGGGAGVSESRWELHDRSSLLTWWPAVVRARVPAPATRIVEWGWERLAGYLDGEDQEELVHTVYAEAYQLGWPEKPVFLRTDQSSAKFSYRKACLLPAGATIRDLGFHLYRILDANFAADLIPKAIVVRQYLELEAPFTAWEGLPIARERRYFVRDGQVVCHHPYWPEVAFESPIARPSIARWREELARLNEEPSAEVALLSSMAEDVGRLVPGYWSVDFARDRDGQWWLIDMAAGEASWHPECGANRAVRA